MDGWIKIHRSLQDNPDYFSEPFTRIMALIDLNILARHDDGYFRKRGILVPLKRGQVAVSRETLAERWKWSPGKVLRYLKELEDMRIIVQQKTNVINCITLVNYDEEQKRGTANDPEDDTPDGTPYRPAGSPPASTTEDTAGRPVIGSAERTTVDTAGNGANGFQTDDRRTANGFQTDAIKNYNKDNNTENGNNNTHTVNSERKGGVGGNQKPTPRQLLDWLAKNVPAVQAMPEPIDEQQAQWLINTYPAGDLGRIFRDIDNKGATRNKSAYSTFTSYAGRDTILKERKANVGKYYTYGEVAEMVNATNGIPNGKYSWNDFTQVERNGQKFWRKTTDLLNE